MRYDLLIRRDGAETTLWEYLAVIIGLLYRGLRDIALSVLGICALLRYLGVL